LLITLFYFHHRSSSSSTQLPLTTFRSGVSPISPLQEAGSVLSTSRESFLSIVVRVVELGPFGCRIDRGTIPDLSHLPEGYEVKNVTDELNAMTVHVEPVRD